MKNVLDFLEDRGFIHQKTSDELREALEKPTAIYLGIDPTASCLHIGHLVGIVLLMHFQKFGHRPVLLIGGATGLIGDPTDKDKERPLLSKEVIEQNVKAITKLLSRYLSFGGEGALLVNNHDWYAQMDVITFLRDVGKQFRVGAMLGKESVRARLTSEEGMSFTELSYQILQGYDFYHLYHEYGVILQVGGSDQYGNITAGTEFIRKVTGKSAYGLTFPLLTRSDGKKFGKTEKGAIWLAKEETSPFEFYQYLYRIPDSDVPLLMKLLTDIPMHEVRAIEKAIKEPGYEPNSAQKRLASELTRLVHGEEGLKEALESTHLMNPGKMEFKEEHVDKMLATMPYVDVKRSDIVEKSYIDLITEVGLVSSKGEARRLVQNQGAYLNGQKVVDVQLKLQEEHFIKGELVIVSAGKKNSVLVRIS